ncbi:MAG: NusG domain II-containing protein [Defluviitaleaceae bacterium]|nr:NusG domain II-containing protein [Defluviitaleaceae bacterium]
MQIKILRKTDIALIIFFVVCALALIIFFFIANPVAQGGSIAITVDGSEYAVLDLNNNNGRVFEIITANGHNEIIIENNSARMQSASCPDRLCLHQAPITRSFMTIVCLPNRVVIEMRVAASGNNPDDLDTIVR